VADTPLVSEDNCGFGNPRRELLTYQRERTSTLLLEIVEVTSALSIRSSSTVEASFPGFPVARSGLRTSSTNFLYPRKFEISQLALSAF
jgi:hypothetical protein